LSNKIQQLQSDENKWEIETLQAAPSTGAGQGNALVPAVPALEEEKEGNI